MDQLDIFGEIYQPFKFTKTVRLIELFAGVGSQAMAFRDLDIPFEHHKVVEFDKYAIRSYNAIHDTDFPTLDIRDIHVTDLDMTNRDYQYVMTYSFPCQDLSKAGNQKGMSKGSGTRSGLLWEVERIIGECWRDKRLPDVLLMENVPDVIGKKNIQDFLQWQAALEACGYQNYIKVINAKDHGIPQNRERCFMVSILGDYSYSFPNDVSLELRLKDMLESKVDEKYYISKEKLEYLVNTQFYQSSYDAVVQDADSVCGTLCASDYKDPKCVGVMQIGNCMPSANRSNPNQGRVYDKDGISPTISCMQGGNRQPMVVTGGALAIPEATKKGYALAHDGDSVNLEQPNSKTRRGRVGKQIAQTLTCSCNQGVVEPVICASRGRNPENPNSRKVGEPTQQMLEINTSGCSNTLTTVCKDNYVLEPSGIYTGASKEFQAGPLLGMSRTLKANKHDAGVVETRFFEQAIITFNKNDCDEGDTINAFNQNVDKTGVSPTITTRPEGFKTAILPVVKNKNEQYRIRKLTPRECWRLMGFTDEDFDKAAAVNSNSQLYKQAGNSIVKQALMAIFKQMM